MRRLVTALALLLVAGCARGEHSGAQGTTVPVDAAQARLIAAHDRDCLQYPVGRDSTGAEIWNADWVFFSLVRDADTLLAKNDDGTPVAVNLLHSQLEEFMVHQKPIPGTSWSYVVQRAQQRVSGGKVVGLSPYELVEDVDLPVLLERDRAARGREPAAGAAPQ